jgi:hypothetical protein
MAGSKREIRVVLDINYIPYPPERAFIMRAGYLLLLKLILEANDEQYIADRNGDDFRGIVALFPVEDAIER